MEYSIWFFLVLFLAMIGLLFTGLPVAFALGGISVFAVILLWGPDGLFMIANSAFSTFTTDTYIAIPMFILMANCLQNSGIAEDLYNMLYKWMGGIRGGLAMGTILICTLFAAMSGGSGAATITMGLIALPSMLKRGYDKHICVGCIAAAGVLGIIIPPSIPMIILAGFGQLSVGKLFFAGVFPGLLCATLYIGYVAVRCAINPNLCPALSKEERVGWKEKIRSLYALAPPILLIFVVLGSIYSGAATPTEAAGLGAAGAMIIAFFKRQLTREVFSKMYNRTFILTAMIAWILIGATAFNTIYNFMGAFKVIKSVADNLPGGAFTVIACMLIFNFVLGCLMDDYAIITLTAPLYLPIIVSLGVDPIWFGLIFMLNLQMAYLTPPFGFNLFYMKSIVPKGISLKDIYISVVPFIGLQTVALVICIIFPQIATWLPNFMIK